MPKTLIDKQSQYLFGGFATIMALCMMLGTWAEAYWVFGLPVALLVAYVCVVDFRKIFYLLLCCLPISMEIELPGGFGTDLPSEPLMLVLTGVGILYFFQQGKNANAAFLRHPLTILLLLHFAWIFIAMLNGGEFVVSLKYFLAKTWYIITFYFMAGLVLKDESSIRPMLWCLFIPMVGMVILALVRHAALDFSFADVNFAVMPFYRNHVNYASIIALLLPFVWLGRLWYKAASTPWWALCIGVVLFLVAIQFSYTRAAYVAIVAAMGYYVVIRLRMTKVVLGLSVVAMLLFINFLYQQNNYLEYAPDYDKAITQTNFDNLLEATYKGEDISTMERVYRWVAGARMVQTKPFIGFGPGAFYNYYKSFTVTSFRTYVSDNPEKSTVHCYYLLMAIEQGIPGFLIFLAMVFYTLIKGEQVYHQTHNIERRRVVVMALLSYVVILCLLLINDMLETDKVGSFFFMMMAILVNVDLSNQQEKLIQK